jgi:hypothetical protein
MAFDPTHCQLAESAMSVPRLLSWRKATLRNMPGNVVAAAEAHQCTLLGPFSSFRGASAAPLPTCSVSFTFGWTARAVYK